MISYHHLPAVQVCFHRNNNNNNFSDNIRQCYLG